MVNTYNLFKVFIRLNNPLTICGWYQGKEILLYPGGGKLQYIHCYKNNKAHGISQGWYPNGQIKIKHVYKNNYLISETRYPIW